ncbi:MAG: PilZ domain-containing protein [Deltaproteobacteria bacterium]|nr:PilZ domain-containing protein [Deltaproteobacteria bacterium]
MSGEARRANKRIDVSRPVELAELDEFGAVVGYTQNLSEDGVRARFDVSPEPSANVLVRLFLEDGAEPLERRGRVVWAAPDIYGDGTDVGLRLIDEEDLDDDETKEGRVPVLPDSVLSVGQLVRVSRGGIGYDAVIAEVGEPDSEGKIQLTLSAGAEITSVEPPPPEKEHNEDEPLDAEVWKPHPFRDAWSTVRRYCGPAARVLATAALTVGLVLSKFFGWAWSKVPAQPRASAESFFKRAGRGFDRVRALLARATSPLTSRLAASKKE